MNMSKSIKKEMIYKLNCVHYLQGNATNFFTKFVRYLIKLMEGKVSINYFKQPKFNQNSVMLF